MLDYVGFWKCKCRYREFLRILKSFGMSWPIEWWAQHNAWYTCSIQAVSMSSQICADCTLDIFQRPCMHFKLESSLKRIQKKLKLPSTASKARSPHICKWFFEIDDHSVPTCDLAELHHLVGLLVGLVEAKQTVLYGRVKCWRRGIKVGCPREAKGRRGVAERPERAGFSSSWT